MGRGPSVGGPLAVLAALVAIAALLAAASAVATAHGNHATVTPQVVADGTVTVESAYTISGGWIAIAVDDNGSPGERIGHVRAPIGAHRAVEVPIDSDALPAGESTRLWAVLHGEDGDGEFDPDADPVARSFSGAAETSFPVRAGDASTAVVAPSLESRPTDGSIEVPRVSLAEPGHVVLQADDDPSSEVVGTAALDAGTHGNVSVRIDDDYLAEQPRRLSVYAIAYTDDGDGVFGGGDDPWTVGGKPVASRIDLTRVENDTGSPSNATDVGFEPSIVTPTETNDVDTADADGVDRTGSDADEDGSGDGDTATLSIGRAAAFVAAGALAVAAGAIAVRRRR